VTVDTCCCIYHLNSRSDRHEYGRGLFLLAARGDISIDLAGITYHELLVLPFKRGSLRELQVALSLTKQQAGVALQQVTETILMAAAQIRAITSLLAPDALVVASAAIHGSSAVVSNDKAFKDIDGISMLKLPLAGLRPISMPAYIHLDDFRPAHAS
jgi:predicted nucleic acid-binding protein